MTKLKICGLRDVENAVAAAEAGADFLGFNFVPGARRRLDVEDARNIIREYRRRWGDDGPRLVGLFADQPLEEVDSTTDRCGLEMVQLCGDEPPEYWDQLSVPAIVQVKVRDQRAHDEAVADTTRLVVQIAEHCQSAQLDKYEAGIKGGTGRSFDWSIAEAVAKGHDFLLAGGLTPENVGGAVKTVHPWGVDVSSGVETDGVKDPVKIAGFGAEMRRADGEP